MSTINYIGLLVIVFFAGSTTGMMAYAEEIQITNNMDYEPLAVLGQDDIGKYVVYPSQPYDGSTLGPGDIFLQRLDTNNNPTGEPINISRSIDGENVVPDAFGDYVVFSSFDLLDDTTGQIILHQISTGKNTIVDSGEILIAKIHNNNIVWFQGPSPNYTIQLNTISGIENGNPSQTISGHDPASTDLEIGDRFVAWRTFSMEDTDVSYYDLNLKQTIDLHTSPDLYEFNPATSGAWIVAEIIDPDLATQSYLIAQNIDTGKRTIIESGGLLNTNPSIDGNLLAFERRSYEAYWDNNSNIFVLDLEGSLQQITFRETVQFSPEILDSIVVYPSRDAPTSFDLYLSEVIFDKDADGIEDKSDNCIETSNPKQLDDDGDGIGNVCDGLPIGNIVFDGNPEPFTFAGDPIEFQFGEPITASLYISALEPRSGTVRISLLVDNDDGSRTVIDYCEKAGVSLDVEESVFLSCTFPNNLNNIQLGRYGIGYSMFGPGSTSTGLPIAVVNLLDSDNDGIEDIVDPQPSDPNNNSFDDGTTSGTIIRGDQILTVTYSASPNGVKVVSDENSGVTPATITDCEGTTYTITAGDEVIITCGSSIIEVIKGPIEAEYDIDGDSATATLNTGDIITFDQDDLSFANNGDNPVIILVNGEEITIESGETLEVILSIPIQVDVMQDSFQCGSKGVVPLTIFASPTFDPFLIDITAMTINGNPAFEKHGKLHPEDNNGDGLDDAIFHHDLKESSIISQENCELVGQVFDVKVSGSLGDGTPFDGQDTVTIKVKGKRND